MPTQDNKSLFPRIYEVVRQVPRGQVASYGQIAEIVGAGCDARMVGYAMAAIPQGSDVPWQRIVNREGKISLPGQGGEIQRTRLEAEGEALDGGDGEFAAVGQGFERRTRARPGHVRVGPE